MNHINKFTSDLKHQDMVAIMSQGSLGKGMAKLSKYYAIMMYPLLN
jgi:hypothetical protein